MSERIEPALTREEWATRTALRPEQIHAIHAEHMRMRAHASALTLTGSYSDETGETYDCNDVGIDIPGIPALIALANAVLPDTDPRKITRHHVWIIRNLAGHVDTQHPGGIQFKREAERLADALESYLPPE
jgi:hypothetical protein